MFIFFTSIYHWFISFQFETLLNLQESTSTGVHKGSNDPPLFPIGPSNADYYPPLPDRGEDGQECYLYLDDPDFRLVARAHQFPSSSTLHHQPILDGQTKVSITYCEPTELATSLPFPVNEEVSILGDAMGTFILWPARLVFSSPQPASIAPKSQRKSPVQESRPDPVSVIHVTLVND